MRAKGWATFFPVQRGVREARRWTAERLDSLRWTTDAPDTAYSVLLTVSELVTNAHVHAHSGAGLVLTWDGRCLHVSVADGDPYLPAPRDPSREATSGRGLAIIDALADDWDAHTFHGGKTITACFHAGATPPAHGARSRSGPGTGGSPDA